MKAPDIGLWGSEWDMVGAVLFSVCLLCLLWGGWVRYVRPMIRVNDYCLAQGYGDYTRDSHGTWYCKQLVNGTERIVLVPTEVYR